MAFLDTLSQEFHPDETCSFWNIMVFVSTAWIRRFIKTSQSLKHHAFLNGLPPWHTSKMPKSDMKDEQTRFIRDLPTSLPITRMKHTVHNGSRPNGTVYTKIKEEFFYTVQMPIGLKQRNGITCEGTNVSKAKRRIKITNRISKLIKEDTHTDKQRDRETERQTDRQR